MTYDCMTPEELTLWQTIPTVTNITATVPCIDCPIWFHVQEKAAGRCNREPRSTPGPAIRYNDEAHIRDREKQRLYQARRRAEACNVR